MNDRPLPPDIIERFGYLPDHRARSNVEHSSACPQCGGARGGSDPSDRFRFWERAGQSCNFWCRRCGFQGFTDDNKPGKKLSAVEILELEQVRMREAEREAQRLQSKIKELQEAAYWRGYHDGMKEPHRALWRQSGIPDSFQDWWELGFVENKCIKIDGKDHYSPAMSIPYFAPDKVPMNVQYRLTNPPEKGDKYRFSYGLRPTLWLAEPDKIPSGAALLMEGMKKAAVTFINTTASGNGRFSVVAVPSKSPNLDMLKVIADCDPVYICLDPDAYQRTKAKDGRILPAAVDRIVGILGNRARLVQLPAKADDLFVEYGFTDRMFMNYVNQATRA